MTLPSLRRNQSGFTLIELLVVIGILAILLAITLIAINPSKHFQDTRNAQRSSNVAALLDGIYEYESANNGNVPPSLSGVSTIPSKLASIVASQNASGTAFSTPDVTFTVPSGNIISDGTVTVTGCATPGNNGTFSVTTGDDTSITVNNPAGASSDTTCVVGSWTGTADLCTDLVPTFLAALPKDPSESNATCSGTYDTGYTIVKSATGDRFTVSAPDAEGSASISVTR